MLVPLLCSSCILLFLLPAKTYSQNGPVVNISSGATSTNAPLLTYCSGDTNITTPSPYKTNLDAVLANLTAPTSYFSTTAYPSASPSAYGLAQCFPDVSLYDCSDCLNQAAAAANLSCPNRTSAAVRYNNCVLRYSDQRFFSQVEDGHVTIFYNVQNATDPTVFNSRLTDLIANISSDAAASTSRFAVGIANYSKLGNIYAMAQCTQDLTAGNCSACLDLAVNYLFIYCNGSIGGQVVSVSCALTYETYSFFSPSLVPPPPATVLVSETPTTPPPMKSISSAIRRGDGGKDVMHFILILGCSFVFTLLTL